MKYIGLVVNQGQGIVATLEHLKFFFLSKSSKAHDSDETKLISEFGNPNDFNLQRYLGMPKSMITYDIKNPTRKLGDTINVTPRIASWTYEHVDKIGIIEMKELRQRGFMDKFKTIDILSELAGSTGFNDITYGTGAPQLEAGQDNSAKFLMLAAIKRSEKDADTGVEQKLAKATYDTLELAQNLASEPDPTGEQLKEIFCEDEAATTDQFCAPSGGAFKSKSKSKKSLNLTKYMRVNFKKSIKKKRSLKASKKRNNKSSNNLNKRKKSKHRKVRKIKA
jgi:hypothetical protein